MDEKKLIIFMDCGDTIIDESTEIRDNDEVVIKANTIPGAVETIQQLHAEGFTLAIVADGLAQSFKNILTQNGVYDYFTTFTYSECMRKYKPHPSMFLAAMGSLELDRMDTSRIIMVGNNLSRDVKGANALGITSVHLDWSPRYDKSPSCVEEQPDYTIHTPNELIELVHKLEEELSNKYNVG